MSLRPIAVATAAVLALTFASPSSAAAAPNDTAHVVGGVTVAATGYLLGVVPALGPGNGAAAYVPLVGPSVWWLAANERIVARVRYEREHPCQGTGEPYSCFGKDTADLDHAAHVFFAMPYAAMATGAQLVGAALLVHGLASRSRSEHGVAVVPSALGATLVGRF